MDSGELVLTILELEVLERITSALSVRMMQEV